MIQFHESIMGKRFIEGTVPQLSRNMERLAAAIEQQNALMTAMMEKLPKAESDELTVNTGLGKLIASVIREPGYPGIDISIQRGAEPPIGLALVEVKEAEVTTSGKEPELHLRPWITNDADSLDEDGMRVPGKVSHDAPYSDTMLVAEDLKWPE